MNKYEIAQGSLLLIIFINMIALTLLSKVVLDFKKLSSIVDILSGENQEVSLKS